MRELARRRVVRARELVERRARREPGRRSASGNHGMNPMPAASHASSTSSECAVDEVVAVLDGDDVHERARALELLDRHVRDPDVADLALVLQLLERAHRVLERDLGSGGCSW